MTLQSLFSHDECRLASPFDARLCLEGTKKKKQPKNPPAVNDGRSLQFAFCLGTKLLKAPFFFFPFSSSSSSFFFQKEEKKRKAPGMVGDGGAETLVLCTWCSITGCWGAPGHLLVRLLSLPLCCMLGKEPLLRDVPFFSWRGPSETSLLMSSPPPRLSSPLLPPSLFYSCTSWNGPPTTHQTPH